MLSLASRTFRPVSSVHFCVSSQTRTFLGLAGYSKRLKGMIKEQKEQRRSGKLRGHPRDSPEVQLSKTVTWLLRHGAKSQGLPMREDGYVRVTDLLASPQLRSLDFLKLEALVRKDEKNRFDLVNDPRPDTGVNDGWWIRANQGHSMQDVKVAYTPLTSADQVPMAVHGTNRRAWEVIATQGLSRMKRTHIHLAQGVPGSGVISGMRSSADILIHVDLAKALAAGVPFFLSSNGVVLTPGDARGFLAPEFFSRVEARKGKALPGWESTGREVFAVPSLSQEAEADVSPSVATAKEDSEVIAETAMEDTSAFAQKEGEAITKAPPAP